MRTVLGKCAVVFGSVGVLACIAVVGLGWRVAARTTARLDHAATRLDSGLSKVEQMLANTETRMNAVHAEFDAIRGTAELIASENPDLPRIRGEIERLIDRLVQVFDRADTLAVSLESVAVGLRTGADVVDQFKDNSEMAVRTRNAADTIDRAAEALASLRTRVDTLKSLKAAQWTRELMTLAREATAGTERLAEGLAAARQTIAGTRARTDTFRDEIVFWIYVAVTVTALIGLWSGMGQLCLIGWGRRSPNLPQAKRDA